MYKAARGFIKPLYTGVTSKTPLPLDGAEGLGSSTELNVFAMNCRKYPDLHRKIMCGTLPHLVWVGVKFQKMSFARDKMKCPDLPKSPLKSLPYALG